MSALAEPRDCHRSRGVTRVPGNGSRPPGPRMEKQSIRSLGPDLHWRGIGPTGRHTPPDAC
eukprot:6224686-Pyramimonas_sp.AAC.1